jgi:hypothetical protein
MNFITREFWTVSDDIDKYWLRKALATVGQLHGIQDCDHEHEILFATRELAVSFGREVMLEYCKLQHPQTWPSLSHVSTYKVLQELSLENLTTKGISAEARFIGDPVIELNQWDQLECTRRIEGRWTYQTQDTTKVIVNGEEYVRHSPKVMMSSWHTTTQEESVCLCIESVKRTLVEG